MLENRVTDRTTDEGFFRYQKRRVELWNEVASDPSPPKLSSYYHHRLVDLYRFRIPPGSRVIELGSGNGDLLAALQPSHGVGLDFSEEMVKIATKRHADLEFLHADVHDLALDEPFDFVVISDLVNDLWDVQAVLERVMPLRGLTISHLRCGTAPLSMMSRSTIGPLTKWHSLCRERKKSFYATTRGN